MKSERAKQYLLKVVAPIAPMYPDCPEECDLKLGEAKRAVELAEQDAEMRMREKAIKAYCSECACYETGACALDPDKCATKLLFVQNMTEE